MNSFLSSRPYCLIAPLLLSPTRGNQKSDPVSLWLKTFSTVAFLYLAIRMRSQALDTFNTAWLPMPHLRDSSVLACSPQLRESGMLACSPLLESSVCLLSVDKPALTSPSEMLSSQATVLRQATLDSRCTDSLWCVSL